MNQGILLTLCIPTNGIIEWVIPVLDSIYAEKRPVGTFEVVVTDNGDNKQFEKVMLSYAQKYSNFIYKKTTAVQFLNQIEAFKLAKGQLIKFVNHRMALVPGALNYLIQYAREYADTKPVTYFLNGVLKLPKENNECDSFDEYVRTLSYWSSWSAGTAMWKTDFDKMDLEKTFNRLFPHTDMIFSEKNSSAYIINNKRILEEIPADITKKGKYDLFNAFSVEYVRILQNLYKDGYISKNTFQYVKNKNKHFVAKLYFDYVVRKYPCSYDLTGYEKTVDIYYSNLEIKREIPKLYMCEAAYKIKRAILKK